MARAWGLMPLSLSEARIVMAVKGYWKGRGKSFVYAWHGIIELFRHEANAQFHLGAAVVVIAAGLFFRISAAEWCAVMLCIGAMFMAEAFNTAVEKLCDYSCQKRNDLIGKVKDIAAGAVLLMTAAVVAVGLIIFIPKIVLFIRY